MEPVKSDVISFVIAGRKHTVTDTNVQLTTRLQTLWICVFSAQSFFTPFDPFLNLKNFR